MFQTFCNAIRHICPYFKYLTDEPPCDCFLVSSIYSTHLNHFSYCQHSEELPFLPWYGPKASISYKSVVPRCKERSYIPTTLCVEARRTWRFLCRVISFFHFYVSPVSDIQWKRLPCSRPISNRYQSKHRMSIVWNFIDKDSRQSVTAAYYMHWWQICHVQYSLRLLRERKVWLFSKSKWGYLPLWELFAP